jgi:alkanesulfonate monooxygenase SsuD/methylene tetrahydromethanopterin reductase-like flavin-dependent oxidoreductase (luciferase family)
MRFGYGLITCQRHPDDLRSDAELYAEALDLAAEAEDLGFDSVWTSEHHFADDSYMPSVLPMSAAMAARTSRVQIGTGLALAPLYDPIRLAEDAATVDAISGGRFLLGLGLGWLDWEFESLGKSLEGRGSAMTRVIRTARQAWSNGLLFDSGVGVRPKPAREGGPPIWIGAHAESAVRRAARLADGFLAGEPTVEEFDLAVRWIRDELVHGEREASAFDIGGYWPIFTWDDKDAWDIVKPYFRYMEWKYEDAAGAKGRLGGELPLPPPLDADAWEALRLGIICGTPDEVAHRIRALREVAGTRFTFVGRFYFPGMDRDVMRRATRLFADEVIPQLG